MARVKTVYTCQNCGAQQPKWMGKCPDCNQWNSFVEETYAAPADGSRGLAVGGVKNFNPPQPITDIDAKLGKQTPTQIPELDRVLGGGMVPGSAILIGGDPGIGKSTLILQTLGKIAEQGRKVLYVSGEESAAQIKMRADRLGVAPKNLWVVTENHLESLLEILKKEKPEVVAIDSVQTIFSSALSSAPGTVSQVREGAGQIITHAKVNATTVLLVGHVTKEGALAGPKVLEHMVDCVLYFESDRGQTFRILRSFKNRFGATHEIGVFEMTGEGLKEVANPSHLFLSQRDEKTAAQGVAGSVVTASLEGTRPLLLEVQALVTHSGLGTPRRTAIGFDSLRLALLVAVLEKIVGFTLQDQDIFVNVAGGLKITEPSIDLGVCAAIASSFRNLPLNPKTLFIGEVGLTGEVRPVQQIETRLREAKKLGFEQAFIPKGNAKTKMETGLKVIAVSTVDELIQRGLL